MKRRGISSLLMLPLINSGRCLGCLGVDILDRQSPWQEHTREMLDVISGVIAQAIDRVETEGSLIAARQKAEQAASIKDEFLATLSHEIRTPLNGMLGLIEMLNETNTSTQQQKLLNNLLSSSKLLLRVIDEIYELDDIRTDTTSLQHSNIRFIDLVDEISVLFKERMKEKNVRFSHDVNTSDVFRGPYLQIRQVLLNLVGNAVKCSDGGAIELNATFSGLKQAETTGKRPELQISIVVSDPEQEFDADSYLGAGLSLQQGLYDWSADLNTFPGSRLGLIVSKQLIEKMNGRISLSKTKGHHAGLRIWFVLPIEDAEKVAKGNLKTAGSGERLHSVYMQDEGRPRQSQEETPALILLGSLDPSLVVLSRQLDSEGVNHRICKTTEDARQTLESYIGQSGIEAEDCRLFVDLNIGREAALSFINEIKNRSEFINMRISLLYAAGQSVSDNWKDACDLDDIVQKPVSTARLRQMLGNAASSPHHDYSETEEAMEPAEGTEASRHTSEKSFPDLRVLVAEDNKVNRMLIKFILERLNLAELKIVENGQEALEAVKAADQVFDLILMDCQMPVMGGFEASRHIRALPDARKANSHITAVTAFATSTYSKHSIEAGMNDYITKPYTIARIQELLSEVSARKANTETAQKTPEAAPAAEKPDAHADLNMEKLRQRFDNNEVLVQEMLEMFLNDSARQLEQLRQHSEAGDWKAFYDMNHQLKGAAATMSAEYLYSKTSALQTHLEQEPAAYDIQWIKNCIQHFEDSFLRIRHHKKKPSQ
jgi:signal transduction histidine kinase/CheY-like chemotaxis protein/HPt (histidine-containing phosphotransfer) domain-containing protein